MERAFSAHLALFLILVVLAAFTGILIYLGRLKRPTVLDVCRFLKPVDARLVLELSGSAGSNRNPTRWHYREFREQLLATRRCFAALLFDLRLMIAWLNSELHMDLVEKPWEQDWIADPPSAEERLASQQELERFIAAKRKLLAEVCPLQRFVFRQQLVVYFWLVFRSHWFLPFPMPDLSKLASENRRWIGSDESQSLLFLYLRMARTAVAAAKLYDIKGDLDGVQACFEKVFMKFKSPQPA